MNDKNTLFTKENIKKIVELWEGNTKSEISKKIGLNVDQITYLSQCIKKSGYKLPRKISSGGTRKNIKEVLTEMNLIK